MSFIDDYELEGYVNDDVIKIKGEYFITGDEDLEFI